MAPSQAPTFTFTSYKNASEATLADSAHFPFLNPEKK